MEDPRASGPDRVTMLDGPESNHKSIMEAFVARKIDAVAAGGDWGGKHRSSISPPPSVVWRRRHRSSESDASSIASSALSIAPPSIMSISPPPTATLSPTFTISSHEQHGWATPKMRARGMSIASLETPTTPTSIGESALPAKHQSVMSKHQSIMKPLPPLPPQQQQSGLGEITIPHRPKRRKHRQSWDSGYRSQMSGPHTRGNSVDESGAAWPSIHRQQQLLRDREAMPPPAPPSEQPEQPEQQQQRHSAPSVNLDALNILESSAPAPSSPLSSSDSEDEDEGIDVDEASSDTTMPAEDAAGRVLNYALDVALGLGAHEIDDDPTCRNVVNNFFSDLQWAVKKSQQQQNDSDQPSRTVSSASNGSRGSRRSTGRSKRKSREGAGEDGGEDGTEEGGGGGGSKQREPGPAKRAKLESPVRMSCPFRKKNPLRFNVRDHRLCALTVFTDTAELRRHIQDCHKRPNNLPQHRCPRCQTQFSTAANLREHLLFRNNVLCEIVDASTAADAELIHSSGGGDRSSTGSNLSSNYQPFVDPEDGIDPATAEKLRSKKGRVSDSIEVQWLKIWELLFPDTEVQPYDYVAVIEHHELHAKYRDSLPVLRDSLSAIGLGDRGLDTLDHILTNHLIGLFEQCNEEGRRKDYRNRYRQSARSSTAASAAQQPQPQQQQQQQQQQPATQLRKQSSLRQRLAAAQRDSGFVDDESYMEGGFTPALTSDDGSSPGYVFVKPGDMTKSSVSPPQHFQGYSPGVDNMMLPGATPTAVTMAGAAAAGGMMAAGSFAADPCFSDYFVPTGHESGDLGLQYGSLGDFQPFGQGLGVYGGGVSGAEMPWMTPMAIGADEGDLGAGQHDSTSAWVYGQPS
ncbi:hypothetical protein MCOR27_002198 [Pyricularia oryzae]|nr:hypothetical protein MCOR19_006453 [Pyricularia oryzae]KAI6285678.1 hypothetical protein MCOR27_002198 [Pyricularia oryzae]KAI6401089.1 hypothetical protein MCOR23_004533 [Pyricularia oryzae]KAI6485782.1 hypothetical protein MCOR18_003663 [Pyricularia oryzae]